MVIVEMKYQYEIFQETHHIAVLTCIMVKYTKYYESNTVLGTQHKRNKQSNMIVML